MRRSRCCGVIEAI